MSKGKVLIVDDDANLLNLVKLAFEERGYSVVTASEGRAGFAMAKSEDPDLMVLDVMLPFIHGYEVCRLLKYNDQYKHIPIILYTSRVATGDDNIWQDVRANAYVSKIEDLDVLLNRAEELIEENRALNEDE